jgi:hypothetical protein
MCLGLHCEIYMSFGVELAGCAAFAIESFKETLNLTSWTGDPCVYTSYNWITCSDNTESPRIATVCVKSFPFLFDVRFYIIVLSIEEYICSHTISLVAFK